MPSNPWPRALCPEEAAIRACGISGSLCDSFLKLCLFIYFIVVALGLCRCGCGLSLVVPRRGYIAVHGLLIEMAFLVSEHRF